MSILFYNPSKMLGVARGHQRADTLNPYSQKTSQSNHTRTTALSNSMKLKPVLSVIFLAETRIPSAPQQWWPDPLASRIQSKITKRPGPWLGMPAEASFLRVVPQVGHESSGEG